MYFVFVLCLPGWAQTTTCLRQIPVDARKPNGDFVPSLSSNNFGAKVHGVPVRVIGAASVQGIHHIVLAVDVSESMDVKRDAMNQIVQEIMQSFPETTQFATVIFGKDILKTLDFEHSRQEQIEAIATTQAPPHSHTAIKDSLGYALRLFQAPEPGDSVILVSDGGDNASKVPQDQVIRAYLSAGVRIFGVFLLERYFGTQEELSGWYDALALISETGGARWVIQGRQDLSPLRGISEGLARFYLLEIETPEMEKPARLEIEAMGSNGKRLGDVGLRFPREVEPGCKQSR